PDSAFLPRTRTRSRWPIAWPVATSHLAGFAEMSGDGCPAAFPFAARAPILPPMNQPAPNPPTNVQEWTVSTLSGALKRTLEDAFGFVRLRAEVSVYRGPHSSGHCYFSLKDDGARIDAVIWKGVFSRLKVKPQEGLEVVVTGRITTFP